MANLNDLSDALTAQFQGLSGRHPGQWPLVPRIFCALGVLFAVLIGAWFFYWSDQVDSQERGAAEEEKLKTAYRVKIAQAINLEALRKQKAQVGQYVATLEKQLPSKAEMDALLSDINQAGVGRGLQFEAFVPGQAVVRDYYAELPIDIRVAGSYHDIGAFTSDIANLSRIVTLNNLNLQTAKDGALTLDAVAKTFRYLDADEVAAQRKAAAAAKAKKGAKS
jgi:type IV pilus assembly protein PilO